MNKLQQWMATKVLGMEVKRNPPPGAVPYLAEGVNYRFVNGTLTMITDNTANFITKGYAINDIVYSIVKLITDKVKVAPWALYNVVDESSLKLSRSILSQKDVSPIDRRKALNLRHKALEPFKGSNKITDLLKYPNEYCTFQDFIAEMVGYILLTGNAYVWGDKLEGGANAGFPNSLNLMPSQFIQIIAEAGFPGRVLGYNIQLQGSSPYLAEDVLHVKEPNYKWSYNGEQWYGMSPLKAALSLLTRNNSALVSTTARFQNQGADGVLFVKSDVAPQHRQAALEQANAVKSKWINEYSGEKNAGKIATSGYDMGYIPIGMSPADLKILESEKWDMRRFCNVYGVPSQLMNDPDNKSFNNVKESEKALTTRCALPKLIAIRDGFNKQFYDNWGMKGSQMIDFDMTVYSELQESVGDSMRWLQPLIENGLPLNYALDTLGMENIDNPAFDEPWIRQSMGVPFSEWQAGAVDNALNSASSLDENV